jgi:diguanylate cyclase (GGDEF)-like protein
MIKTKFKRNSDCVARIGGEEFGVLMPLTDFKKVSDMADELRQTVEASPIDWEGESIKVTVSGGVASCLPSHLIKSIEMFKLADNCLYQAKNEGRNKTIAKTFNDSQQQNS